MYRVELVKRGLFKCMFGSRKITEFKWAGEAYDWLYTRTGGKEGRMFTKGLTSTVEDLDFIWNATGGDTGDESLFHVADFIVCSSLDKLQSVKHDTKTLGKTWAHLKSIWADFASTKKLNEQGLSVLFDRVNHDLFTELERAHDFCILNGVK